MTQTASKIHLLVVDDSNFVRVALRKMLESAPDIEVVGEARNGAEALRLTRKLRPHVVAMDVNMPVMDGIEAVQAIVREKGPPVIMVSSETSEGAEATIRSLEAGAVDFVCKATSFIKFDMASIERQLTEKIRYWAQVYANRATAPKPEPASTPTLGPEPATFEQAAADERRPRTRPDLVVVGVSTGGPGALPDLLRPLGALPCPVVVAQHMPAAFTATFAASLARSLGRAVVEGSDGQVLEAGAIVILRGGGDTQVRRRPDGKFVLKAIFDSQEIYHPSANLLLRSAAAEAHAPVAVILTGMGNDGTAGSRDFAARNLPVLVQEPCTCAVDGMPSSAIREGLATAVLPVAALGRKLNTWLNP